MARSWELRPNERWRTRAMMGFGLSGLVLNSLLLWFAYATLSASPYASLPGLQKLVAWYANSPQSGSWTRALAPIVRDPLAAIDMGLTLAAVIGIVYATLRGRFDPAPEVGTTGFRARRILLQIVGFVLPFLPLCGLGWFLFRLVSTQPR